MALRRAPKAKITGNYNDCSNDERLLYQDIERNLELVPHTPYAFLFNINMVELGAPSNSFYIKDYKNKYLQFVQSRCRVSENEALHLLTLVGEEAVHAINLSVDVVKVRGKEIVLAMELNRGQHYIVPPRLAEQKVFAREVFRDMIKEQEMRKVCNFYVANYNLLTEYGISSTEVAELVRVLYDFTHNL